LKTVSFQNSTAETYEEIIPVPSKTNESSVVPSVGGLTTMANPYPLLTGPLPRDLTEEEEDWLKVLHDNTLSENGKQIALRRLRARGIPI